MARRRRRPEHWLEIGARYRRELDDPESLPGIGRRRTLERYGADLADLKDEALFEVFQGVEQDSCTDRAWCWRGAGPGFDRQVRLVWKQYTGQGLRRKRG